ncbi:hypothetical protein B0H10DRAFT_158352 [Mycena sp. CBHHK59/15]|nr:hypothetical protein B0H10DRAFT_158352 [Mycena sp. CBHHK59/15]
MLVRLQNRLLLLGIFSHCVYGWHLEVDYVSLSDAIQTVVVQCRNLTFHITGLGGIEPFSLTLVPYLNTSQAVREYNFTNKLAPLTIVLPYPHQSSIIPVTL